MQLWSRLTADSPHFACTMDRLQSSWDARPARAWWWRAAARYAWQQLWAKTSNGRPNTTRCSTMQLLSCLISRARWRWHLIAHGCSSKQHSSVQAAPAPSTVLPTMYEHAELTTGVGQGTGQPGGVRPGMQPGPNGPMMGQAQGQAGQSMGMRPSFSGGLPPGQTLCCIRSLANTSTVIMACCDYPLCVANYLRSRTCNHPRRAQHRCSDYL